VAHPADRSRRGDLARHRCRGVFLSIWVAAVCVLDLRAFISRAPQSWLAAAKEGTTHDGEDRSCAQTAAGVGSPSYVTGNLAVP
jgi:hypothetical protein